MSADEEPGPERRHRLAASLGRRPVEDELPVEVVELVLRNPRGQPLQVVCDLVAVLVTALDPDRERPLDRHGHTLKRETPLVVGVDFLATAHDLRIDEDGDDVVLRGEDEGTPENPDLRRRQPHTAGVLHQIAHPGHEPAQVVVELLHGPRLHAEDRIGVLPDLRQRELPPRFVLGVELFGPNLSFDVFHLRHRLRCRHQDARALLARPSELTGRPTSGSHETIASAQLAALGGPLAWMRRLRAIEIAVRLHEDQLGEAWKTLREECDEDAPRFAREWRSCAERWDFHEVNDLIERHNRHYPAESRLPMNPRTGDFVLVNGRPYTRAPLDASWILARFPADKADLEVLEWNRSRDTSLSPRPRSSTRTSAGQSWSSRRTPRR